MNTINTLNGVILASRDEVTEHAENPTVHLTEEERIAWNAKADASQLDTKADASALSAHETNTTVHVSQEEKEKWSARNTNGVLAATQDGLDEHAENKTIHLTEEERQRWNSQMAESDIRALVDARLYEAGAEVKKLKSSQLEFPREGGHASLIVDTNVPFLPYWFSIAAPRPTPHLPPNATVVSTEKGLEIEVTANKSVGRILYGLEVYAGDPEYGPWSEMGTIMWLQHSNAVGDISLITSEGDEYDFLVTCNYPWRLAASNLTVTPSSGEAGTTQVHGIATSDYNKDLALVAMDDSTEESIYHYTFSDNKQKIIQSYEHQ